MEEKERSNSILKNILSITVISIIMKLMGLMRDVLFANNYGISAETDAYFMAVTIINIITLALIKFIDTSFIPIISDEKAKGDKNSLNNAINVLLLMFVGIAILIIVLLLLFSNVIINTIASGFTEEQKGLTDIFIKISCASILISIIVSVFKNYLHLENRFTKSAISELPYNMTFIVYLLCFSRTFHLHGMIFILVIGGFFQLLFYIPTLNKLKYRFYIPDKIVFPGIKIFFKMAPAIMLSAVVSDINQIINQTLASNLAEGIVSAINYSMKIRSFVLALLIAAIPTIFYPILSEAVSNENHDKFNNSLTEAIIILLILSLPATVGIMTLSELSVKIILLRGQFDEYACKITSELLKYYSICLPSLALKPLLKNAFFAMKNSRIPMINNIITIIVNIILSISLIQIFDYYGLAVATSISTILTSLILLFNIKKIQSEFKIKRIAILFFKVLTASVCMGVIVKILLTILDSLWKIDPTWSMQILTLTISIFVGCLSYIIILKLLRVKEINIIFDFVKKRLCKR